MQPYLHIFTEQNGFVGSFIWPGHDEDNAYYRLLSHNRKRGASFESYSDALNIRSIIEPLIGDILTITLGHTQGSMRIFTALYRSLHYTLPAIILSETAASARQRFQEYIATSGHPVTLLQLQDSTDNFTQIANRYAAELGWAANDDAFPQSLLA